MTDRFPTRRDRDHFPFLGVPAEALMHDFEEALAAEDLETASFAFLELRHRRPKSKWVRDALQKFSVTGGPPIEWLGVANAAARRFRPRTRGRASVYLILLDPRGSTTGDWGVYVGETNRPPEVRYGQHCTGAKASRRVKRLRAGLLRVPGCHLRGMDRSEAKQIEADLAGALETRGIWVRGGH